MKFMPTPDPLETTFIDAIALGWGLSLNCQPCGVQTRWTDKSLADRFLLSLDKPISAIRGRVRCPECGSTGLRYYLYQSGAMNWRPFSIAQSDLPAAIEDHKAELREMATVKQAPAPDHVAESYASMKKRV